jgi:hypothetical protein
LDGEVDPLPGLIDSPFFEKWRVSGGAKVRSPEVMDYVDSERERAAEN